MADTFFRQVVDGAGNVSFVPVSGAVSAGASGGFGGMVSGAAGAVGDYMSARSGEQSTLLGAVGGAALAPTIAQNVADTLVSVATGNYVGALATGLPALIGIVGSLAAIFTPEKAKGLSDDEIKTAVGGLSREQLISLLEQSASADSTGNAGNNAGVAIAVPTAVKTV